jgi:hypothetical protein
MNAAGEVKLLVPICTFLLLSGSVFAVVESSGVAQVKPPVSESAPIKTEVVKEVGAGKKSKFVLEEEIVEPVPGKKKLKHENKSLTMYETWKKESPFKFRFNGDIRFDCFWDSRQGWVYWDELDFDSPKPKRLDPNGEDVENKASFNIAPFPEAQVAITGPELWNAYTSALIKGDMSGKTWDWDMDHVSEVFKTVRIKHAYFQFDWEKTMLRCGLYYHPIAMVELCPDTVSLDAGELIDPFQYSFMFLARQKFDPFELVAAVGRTAYEPDENKGIMPHIYLRLNMNIGTHMICIGNDVRLTNPRLYSDKSMATNPITTSVGYKEAEKIPAFLPFIAASIQKDKFHFKTRLLYGYNEEDYQILGGYAVCQRDPATDLRHYTGMRCVNFWFDTAYTAKKWEVGLFCGVTKNLGASKKIQRDPNGNLLIFNDYFGPWWNNVALMWRVQPRVRWFRGPLTIGLELEHSDSAIGTPNDYGKPCCNYHVHQDRVICSFIYAF